MSQEGEERTPKIKGHKRSANYDMVKTYFELEPTISRINDASDVLDGYCLSPEEKCQLKAIFLKLSKLTAVCSDRSSAR